MYLVLNLMRHQGVLWGFVRLMGDSYVEWPDEP